MKEHLPFILKDTVGFFQEETVITKIKYDYEKNCFIKYQLTEDHPLQLIVSHKKIEGSKLTLLLNSKLFLLLAHWVDGVGNSTYDKPNNLIAGLPIRIDTTIPDNLIVIEEIVYKPMAQSC